LVLSAPEAEGVTRFELDEAVAAFGGGVGDPGGQVNLDAVPPLLDCLGEGDEFGQVGVVGDAGEEAVAGGGDPDATVRACGSSLPPTDI
jgi:hypothetical protein